MATSLDYRTDDECPYPPDGEMTHSGRNRLNAHSPEPTPYYEGVDRDNVFHYNTNEHNQTRRSPAMPSLPLPVYDRQMDWNTFEHLFMEEMDSCNIPHNLRITYLKRVVPSDGLTVLMDPRVRNFEDAITELRSLYKPHKRERDVHTEFLTLRQRNNEPYRALAARLQTYIRSHPEHYVNWTPVGQDSLVLDQFVEAIANPDVRKCVYDKEPANITEAVEFANKKEKYLEKHPNKSVRFVYGDQSPSRDHSPARSDHSPRSTNDSTMRELIRKLDRLESKISRLENSGNKSPPLSRQSKDIKDIQCFWCQKYGHYQSRCPARKAGEPKVNRKSLNSNNQS